MVRCGVPGIGPHLEVWHSKGVILDRKGKGLGLVERSGKATCSVNIARANTVRELWGEEPGAGSWRRHGLSGLQPVRGGRVWPYECFWDFLLVPDPEKL